MTDPKHKWRTLALLSSLHGFTHLYQVALMPLYLPIQRSFKLESVGSSTFLVTLMMVSYFLPSYPMGVLADRMNRKRLLEVGLVINGLGFIGLALAPNYPLALLSMVITGLGGSFYHPAATALVAQTFPVNTGRALGITAIGAGAGFFAGPLYAGWRAGQAGDWRAPVLELGIVGLVGAGLFSWLAGQSPVGTARPAPTTASASPRQPLFRTASAAALFVGAALAFSLRDFAGSSMGSLGSLFLQNAYGYSVQATGLTLSAIFVASVISNPLFGHLSDRGRKRWACFVHAVAAVLMAIIPFLPGAKHHVIFVAFMAYGFFFLASYPIVEAGVMQSINESVRGRAFGLWITIGGLIGSLSHWLMGAWVERFEARAGLVQSYHLLYSLMAGFLLLSLLGLPLLEGVRRRESAAAENGSGESKLPLPESMTR